MRFTVDLIPDGKIRREMRGLQIVLSHNGPAYRLALAREDVYPSDQEIEVSAVSYGVPQGAGEHRFTTTSYHPKTGRKVKIHVVEFTWQDLDAPTDS